MQIKEALAEILKMLKPGGKLMLFETHVMYYTQKSNFEGMIVRMKPKEDGTEWNYYEDEGAPREVCHHEITQHYCGLTNCCALTLLGRYEQSFGHINKSLCFLNFILEKF